MNTALSLLAFFFLLLSPAVQAVDRLTVARDFLDAHRVHRKEVIRPAEYDTIHASIATSRDPGTTFGPYIFALANPKSNILTAEQLQRVQAEIEARRDNPVNWHDVRNIVRMQSIITLWAYAAEPETGKAAALKSEWNAWTGLVLAYQFEEFVMQERFQRAVWAIFTPDQRRQIVEGSLDALIQKNTGHSRAFSAHKQVLKALGEPADQNRFDLAVARWEKKWKRVTEKIEAAASFDRRRALAMDDANEAFAVAARAETDAAFLAFVQAERDAIRDLVQACYQTTPHLPGKVAAYQEKLRAQMVEKYGEHAGELLRLLGEMK